MVKVDLHLHSEFSNHPSEWFLQKLGASESYTKPEYIYKTAKERGMDFVTITDHNNIEGAVYLKNKYPNDTFISVESTVYFPEDGGKVHILLYNITEEEFKKIQKLRKNIYKLRDFIIENDMLYSVAHATYSVNGTLKLEHLEKLILLFDVFESVNGGRSEKTNTIWTNFLKTLTKEEIEKLKEKHNIEVISDTPWIKGYTAGSDDHAGIFMGKTYTTSKGKSINEFLNDLRIKKTQTGGRNNNFQSLAFTIYKIAYDFARTKSIGLSKSLLDNVNSFIFEDKKMSFRDKLKLKKIKNDKNKTGNEIRYKLVELIEDIKKSGIKDKEERLDIVYKKVGEIVDEFAKLLFSSVEKNLKNGDIYSVIQNVSASLPGLFLCIPFISTFKLMFNNREIVNDLKKSLGREKEESNKRIIWFTDTLTDLNGVSVTLRKMGWNSYKNKKDLKIVSSLMKSEIRNDLPPNVEILEPISNFKLPYYKNLDVKIPSILSALKMAYEFDPDEVYISTPGSIGLLGLFISKLLNVKSIGVYHTDFTMQSKAISENASLATMLETGSKWFYSQLDQVSVPTQEYIDILSERGFDKGKMKVFKRGIETEKFFPVSEKNTFLLDEFKVNEGINMLYVGRISKDKHLDFLLEIFNKLRNTHKEINLILVGNGPYLEELRIKYKKNINITFTGKIENELLPKVYQSSDLFLFPSITDTFGMAVLEAQACGIPAIVSNVGGPKEIVVDNDTGYVLKALDKNEWKDNIEKMISIIKNDREKYKYLSLNSYEMVQKKYTWNGVMKDIFN